MSDEECKEAFKWLLYIHLLTLSALKGAFEEDERYTKRWIIISSIIAAFFTAIRLFIHSDLLLFPIGYFIGMTATLMLWRIGNKINLDFVKNLLREWSKEAEGEC